MGGAPRGGTHSDESLAVFLHGMSPAVAVAAGRTLRELSRFNIGRLAAANPSTLEEFACLVAAKSAGISRVLIQHGDHLLSYASWLITQTGDFDEFAATDPTMGDELRATAARLGVTAPRVSYYAPRVSSLRRRITRRPRPPTPSPRSVCYVPCFLLGDSRYVGACNFDDAWYHRWHLRILDLMASRPDCRFIWKGLPSSDQLADPIPGLIADRGYANVSYKSRPLLDVIAGMDRIFTDYPSTALFEAVHVRKPILALLFLASVWSARRPRRGLKQSFVHATLKLRRSRRSVGFWTRMGTLGWFQSETWLFLDHSEHERQFVEREDRGQMLLIALRPRFAARASHPLKPVDGKRSLKITRSTEKRAVE